MAIGKLNGVMAPTTPTGLRVTRPNQSVRRESKRGDWTHCGSSSASRPSGHSQRPQPALSRTRTSITAIPCSTPKLIQLPGNISALPALTNNAQPATCPHRRQKRGQKRGLEGRDAMATA